MKNCVESISTELFGVTVKMFSTILWPKKLKKIFNRRYDPIFYITFNSILQTIGDCKMVKTGTDSKVIPNNNH